MSEVGNEEGKEVVSETTTNSSSTNGAQSVSLTGIYAFKMGMSTLYNEKGDAVAVTILKQDNWIVSQVKTPETDKYSAVQISCQPKSTKNTTNSEKGHFKKIGERTFIHTKEIRQDNVSGIQVGQTVDIGSIKKGDIIRISAQSKGRGFQGSVKRYGFAGGPAAHGSHFHRQPGSSGNRTWPGRVMPGKKFPGHMGDRQVTLKHVEVYDVLPEENVVIVKGPVPGAPNGLVRLMKE